MNQIFDHAVVDTGAEGAVKAEFLFQAFPADVLDAISGQKAPTAGMAEGRRVLLNLLPAAEAD